MYTLYEKIESPLSSGLAQLNTTFVPMSSVETGKAWSGTMIVSIVKRSE